MWLAGGLCVSVYVACGWSVCECVYGLQVGLCVSVYVACGWSVCECVCGLRVVCV
jgi:hypothetical protein